MAFRDHKERKSIREQLSKKNDEAERNLKAHRVMASKLLELVENDKIPFEFDCDFIRSVMTRLNLGIPLSEKQKAHLEKCFEKY